MSTIPTSWTSLPHIIFVTDYTLKNCIFWDTRPCSPLNVNRRFGGTRNQLESRVIYLLHAVFLLGSFIDPEDGGDMFLRNIG
jgi:hypothetical protein